MTHIADAESILNLAHQKLNEIEETRGKLGEQQHYWQGYHDMAEQSVEWQKQAQVEVSNLQARISQLESLNDSLEERINGLLAIPEVASRIAADQALLHSRTAVDTGL